MLLSLVGSQFYFYIFIFIEQKNIFILLFLWVLCHLYTHMGLTGFMMQCNEQIFLFSFLMLMWKSKYANASDGIKWKRNGENLNMDKYRFYLPARIQCFKSSGQNFSPCSSFWCIIWLGVGLDICTSWYGVTHVLRLFSSSRYGIGSILLSVFALVDPSPSLGGIWEL